MTEIVDRFANLSLEQRQLVLKKIQERGLAHKKTATENQAPPIVPVSRDQNLPLSFSQQRLWFIDQWEPGDPTYNVFSAVRLTGRLKVEALEWGLNEVVRRHEILRTTFAKVEGQPSQVIAPTLSMPLPLIDLRELPPTEREAEAHRGAVQEAQWSFDLASGPLMRTSLLWLASTDHLLLVNMHHIVSDGWSMGVFVREMALLYQAFIAGRPAPLPDLPFQYADFAVWQREWLQGAALEQQLAYWQTQLADAKTVLDLPTDHPRPPMQTSRGAVCPFQVPAQLTEALRALSRAEESTLFMTLLAAFNVLLHRYTGQSDILVGTPIANRRWDELEGLIGFFVNTLVLRTNLTGAPTFRELLRRVRETTLGAYGHQDIPFEMLVEKLQHERDISRAPLFQVMFVLQNVPQQPLKSPSLTLSPVEVDSGTSMFDLGLGLVEVEDGLTGEFQYNTDLFDEATIARLVSHWQNLLAGIVANPDRPLWDLPLLTEAERHQLLVEWNATQAGWPKEQCIHELFEAQVAQTPDAIAAVGEAAHLSYEQLNRRANGLAAQLVAQGVGADTVVGLLANRGLDFLTAMLAVFKAGGAYLPLDPRYPASRLRQVVVQSRSRLVLCATALLPGLQEALAGLADAEQPAVLDLEATLAQVGLRPNLPVRHQPGHLAYVIYTSGSTGLPKGAMVEQRGMVNHLFAKIRDLTLTGQDIVAQTAPQSFDISVWQFLAGLLVGGAVHILGDEVAFDPTQLLAQVAQRHVTVLETVPSLLRAMLDATAAPGGALYDLRSLRWLMPTGEALPPELARQWLRYYPGTPVINAYGPTECSDDVTHYPFATPPDAEVVRIPIGRPVANMRLYVLDGQGQPVPVGVAGELYVGGVGVGRGYLHEPVKTAQAFVPDPFTLPMPPPSATGGETGGARLYRTGDLAYWRADGQLEFLGRVDHQVKVRGFRIELGEIEAVVRQQPAVREAVVVVREDQPGDQRLVAYVVAQEGQAVVSGEVRRWVQERLPEYMVPSAVVEMAALPLTPNGKLDRRALPLPGKRSADTKKFVAPEGPLEEKLAEIWRQTLKVDQISTHDNFFDLGGHSLLATQVIYRVNKTFQIDLSLRNLFETPTVARMALLIEETLLNELEEENEFEEETEELLTE